MKENEKERDSLKEKMDELNIRMEKMKMDRGGNN